MDTAVSRALLVRVSGGETAESLRIYRPGRAVVFGRLDKITPGFGEAVRAARGLGFEAVLRLVGGRAAVFDDGTIAFAHAVRDSDPTSRTEARFEATAELLTSALRRLGVDARVGEIEGEYCPGAYSINAGGRKKLVGIGQRIVSGGAHVGGVIVVGGVDRIRAALESVYSALGLEWNPATVGAVDEEVSVTFDDVVRAVLEEYGERYDLQEGRISPATLDMARKFEPDHQVDWTSQALQK